MIVKVFDICRAQEEFNSVQDFKVPRKTLTAGHIPTVGKTHALRKRWKERKGGGRERKRREMEQEDCAGDCGEGERRKESKRELDRGLQMLAIARIKDVSTFSSDRHHFIRSPSANKCFPSAEAVL